MSNAIPNDIRPPLCYIGFDNSKAIIGTAAMPHQILVIGQMLPTGRAEACTLYPFNDGDEAAALWGRGSLMHGLASQVKGANRFTQVLGVALPEAFNLVDKDYQASVKTAAVESEGSLMVGFKTPTLEFDVDESEAAEQGWRVSVGNKTAALKSFSTQTGFMVIAAGEGLAAADLAVDVSMTLHGVEATTAGVAARGVQRFIGTALEDAIIYLHIAGKPLSILAQKGDTAAEMAQNITNAVNGDDDFPVRAESADGAVTYIAKQTGETGNDIRVVCNYYAGQAFPSGVMTTNISLSGGQGNPDVSDAISAMADEWFNHIIMPYRDTANLNALRDEMTERWGPMKMTEGTAYLAFSGTHAQTATFGESRNDFLYSCMGAGSSPTPAYLWAASYGAIAAYELAIDPARPLQTLVLPGVLPPPVSERWDLNERNLLLHDGIATHKVDAGGNVMIEREVTMYRLNSYGRPDPSYLDLTTPHTLGYIRYATVNRITQKFPRHKLADDGQDFDPTQPIVTPSIINMELIALYMDLRDAGIVENVENYKEALYCERDKNDRNRVNVIASPDLVNQFRVFAMMNQFVL